MAMFNEDKNLKSGGCADEIAALIRDDLSPKMIQEQLENYHNSDIAKSMEQMDRLGRMRLIRSIEPDKLAGIFKYVEPQEAAVFLKDIDTARAVFILEKIDPDAAADILRELPGSDRSAMIGLLNGALRKKIELLVSFDEDEIGSRMSANFISLDSEMTVGQATRALMDQAKENDNIQMLFVTAENGFFCGTVELRALLIAEKNAAIAPLIQHRFPYVYCSERTEDCIERLKSYSESAIPVLDASNCILGVITLRDLVEAVDDEMSDDYAKLGGLSAEEDLHEPLRASLKKRMPWLLVLLVLGAVLIALGANLLVDNGTIIAKELGVPETVIALTFVALGTSLPELVTAITSLVKGHGSLSVGNIIGANLFNLVLVSGVSVTLAPFEVPVGKTIFGINSSLILDMPLMIVVMALLTIPALTTKKLHRWQGILLLCIYAAFCAIQFGL